MNYVSDSRLDQVWNRVWDQVMNQADYLVEDQICGNHVWDSQRVGYAVARQVREQLDNEEQRQ